MSDPVLLALIAGVPATLTGLGAIVLGVLNRGAIREVHTLTNSNLSKVTASLDVAQAEIKGLKDLVAALANPPAKGNP